MIEESITHASKFLNTPITIEETNDAIKSLKTGKAGGHNGVVSEHLK